MQFPLEFRARSEETHELTTIIQAVRSAPAGSLCPHAHEVCTVDLRFLAVVHKIIITVTTSIIVGVCEPIEQLFGP